MSRGFKIGSFAGGVGTIAGATATTVLATKAAIEEQELKKDIEDKTKKDELKTFLDTFGITAEDGKSIFETIKEKTKDFWKDGEADISKVVSSVKGFLESEIGESGFAGIDAQKIKGISEIKDLKGREAIEKLTKDKLEGLDGLKGFKEFEEGDRKNNLCELVQMEFVKRIIKQEFKFVATSGDNVFGDVFGACVTEPPKEQ